MYILFIWILFFYILFSFTMPVHPPTSVSPLYCLFILPFYLRRCWIFKTTWGFTENTLTISKYLIFESSSIPLVSLHKYLSFLSQSIFICFIFVPWSSQKGASSDIASGNPRLTVFLQFWIISELLREWNTSCVVKKKIWCNAIYSNRNYTVYFWKLYLCHSMSSDPTSYYTIHLFILFKFGSFFP